MVWNRSLGRGCKEFRIMCEDCWGFIESFVLIFGMESLGVSEWGENISNCDEVEIEMGGILL